jgi:hypothetical protein
VSPKEARVLADYALRKLRKPRKLKVDKNEILIRYALLHIEYVRQIEANQQKDKQIADLQKQVKELTPIPPSPSEQANGTAAA